MSIEKIIDLDAEVSTKKIMVALILEIYSGGIYTAMTLMNQNTMVLLQIVVLRSKIRCFGTVIFILVSYLVDIITKDKYLLIFYQKL